MNAIYLIYIAAISLLAVALTLHDKSAARRRAWRVRERTLLLVSALGGSVAMLATMLIARHKTRRKKFMLFIPLIIAAQILFVTLVFNQSLEVSHFNIATDKITTEIKFALITDFHSCYYGKGGRELLDAIDAERPDAVLLCGDIFDDELPPDNTLTLLNGIAKKYPCYYVSGNHEFWSGRVDDFKNILLSYGVKVLCGTSELLEIRGEKIKISGIDDPETDYFPNKADKYNLQLENLQNSIDSTIFTILLSHRPERISELLPLNCDLVVSGHAHGGQWRIPYILENGLIAPNQGFFPKYTNGEYFFGNTELIVSRGLARESTAAPRMFNRPELVIISLQ
jgi:predicted MPP superfamily phosphohydrolase